MSKTVLAFDFGASSGRAIKARFDPCAAQPLSLTEVHRFDNTPVERDGFLTWDFDRLMEEIAAGFDKAGMVDSVGFDSWGVDFGLLDADGRLIAAPVHYRDGYTEGAMEEAAKRMPPNALFEATGLQMLSFNTLFQLLAVRRRRPDIWDRADKLLFMPDLFRYALGGPVCCDTTVACTSQMLDPRTGQWRRDVLERYGIPESLLPPIRKSGSLLTKVRGIPSILVAGHDTQSAVTAMPVRPEEADEAAFVSCGTWSLFGCELDRPILTPESRKAGLSNELGADGRIHYLKNISGLWLIQESRREWRRQGREYSYADLERLALDAEPRRSFIDPDAPDFVPPGDIPGRVQAYCAKTGQPVPQSAGEIMRCIYESLAMKYRVALDQFSRMTGRTFRVLHLLGGGAKDRLLCQLTADSLGIPVVAGPAEATALGNVILQLIALGELPDIAAGRRLIRQTQPLRMVGPNPTPDLNKAYARYTAMLESE